MSANLAPMWDNKSTPGGATNTLRGLTRSSDYGREGLAMKATRFWNKVRTAGQESCWEWTAGTNPAGYGVFHPVKGETVGAHRYSLALKLGRPIQPGMYACHTCDNPPCVNPDHLYEGTHQDNVNDAVRRGRNVSGERCPAALLTIYTAQEIRERFAAGEYITDLAAEFGISLGAASNVINGKTWRSAGGPIRPAVKRGRRSERERAA